MRRRGKIRSITEWSSLWSEPSFICGRPAGYDVTIEISIHALNQLFRQAVRDGIIVTAGQGYRRNRGSLERIEDA